MTPYDPKGQPKNQCKTFVYFFTYSWGIKGFNKRPIYDIKLP